MTETEQIVFVDEQGNPTGETGPKLASHTGDTQLHLAFSCYIFRSDGEFLLTQRAFTKKVWPGVWTNSVCGHPAPGEPIEDAIRRRAAYEIGITELQDIQAVLPQYRYRTPPYNGIIENEFCPVYIAYTNQQPQPNPEEVEAYEWLPWPAYAQRLQDDPDHMSYWAKDQYEYLQALPFFRQKLMERRIILASGSPRRKELLTKMGVTFEAIPSDFDEYLDDERPVTDMAIELALGKAQVLADKYPDAIVIGSDTIVTLDDRQFGKPTGETDARLMLYAQVGHRTTVTTSVVVLCKELGIVLTAAPQVSVVFKRRNDKAIAAYLATGDWQDKAAAWGIQSGAAPLISHIEGEYSTIIGLPVTQLAQFLNQLGIATQPVILMPPVPQRH